MTLQGKIALVTGAGSGIGHAITLALAEAGASHFTVVTADSQSAGKGRAGKSWESSSGMGLWISFLVRSAEEVPSALVPILVGLAATRALERLCPSLRPGIKWPNDIEVEGRKLGGILCERAGAGAVVVGVGLNLHQGIEDFDPGHYGDEVDTVGGLIFALAGRVPARGEVVSKLKGFDFEITRSDVRRVKQVRISRKRRKQPLLITGPETVAVPTAEKTNSNHQAAE